MKYPFYRKNDGMFWEPPKNAGDYIWRYEGNPLFDVHGSEHFWHIFNSAVVYRDGKYVGVYRVEDKGGKPLIVLGSSDDGIGWKLDPAPVRFTFPDGSIYRYPYAYDPRVVEIDGIYYVIFCVDDDGPCIHIAKSSDLKTFTVLPSGFLPCNRNGVLFPEKIDGKYLMLSRPFGREGMGSIYLSESADLMYWGNHKRIMRNFDTGDNYWERIKIGPGPAPIKTDEGWILIYHGVQKTCNGLTYSFGAALLDLLDPSKVLYKAKRYLLTPEEPYETVGFTPNVCFPCGALTDGDGHVTIYYGVADTNMAVAFTTVEKLLQFVKKYDGDAYGA